jgi:ribonucleotide monophosphatase NagD (HAD superfamily)
VVTSAQAAARLVEPGATALVCGGDGVAEALEARDVRAVDAGSVPFDSEEPFDAVVVGFHRNFDYHRLTVAFRAVDRGARLIGTNDDPTYPTPEGLLPGGGSILAAVATAAGIEAEVAGKPNQPIGDELAERLGAEAGEGTVLVGDKRATDGLMAKRLGLPFYMVLSGVNPVSADDDEEAPEGDILADDLATLVEDVLGGGSAEGGQESA